MIFQVRNLNPNRFLMNKKICKYLYHLSQSFSSALYITGDKAQKTFAVLSPYIDIDERLENKKELLTNIKVRNLNIDLLEIEKSWLFYKNLLERRKVLDQTRNEIGKELNQLQKTTTVDSSDIQKLKSHGKILKEDLRTLRDYMYDIEEKVALKALSLPNVLHSRTPHSTAKLIHTFLEKPSIKSQHHLKIAEANDLLEYYDSFYYFLKHDCSLFELKILNDFQNHLLNSSYTEFSNADFARSIVVEGCGGNFKDPNEFFTLEDSSDSVCHELSRLHLVGGASLQSFMSYLTRHLIQTSYFPLKCFSIGRKYTPPINADRSLFNTSQENAIDFLIAVKSCDKKEDTELDDIISLLKFLYDSLGFHYTMVVEPAHKLKSSESLRISLQMFSCSLQEYVEVAHISSYDTYLSKRLLCTYTEEKERKFPKIIGGTVLSVQKLLGCILEYNSVFKREPLFVNSL